MKTATLLILAILLLHKTHAQTVDGFYHSNELSFVSNTDHLKDYKETDKSYFMAIQLDSLNGGEILIVLPQYKHPISYSLEKYKGQINDNGILGIIFEGVGTYGIQKEEVEILIYNTETLKLMFLHKTFSIVFHNIEEVNLQKLNAHHSTIFAGKHH